MDPQPLAGRTVAVPETRELEVFAAMLERRGASVLRCPLVAIHDAPDPAPVLAFARSFAGGSCDDLILSTGEGLRRILACIERHEPALKTQFLVALASVRKITRGPKPARALRELGLKPDLPAQPPTTAGIIASLAGQDLKGRRVGVQLYGTEPNRPLMEFLERAGAIVLRRPMCMRTPPTMRRCTACWRASTPARWMRSPSPAHRRSSGCSRSRPPRWCA